ncbi:ECF transporter S component [Kineococcus sp. NUM-3379]
MTAHTPQTGRAGTPPVEREADGGSVLARRPLTRWRTVDLTTAAMLGAAFGVVFWGWDQLYYALSPTLTALFPPVTAIVAGVWLLPAVVGALVIRRPGAALFVEVLAATIEALLGNVWGTNVLISGFLQGLGVEIVVAAVLWRRFGPAVAVLAGVAAATLEVTAWEWHSYVADYSWTWKLLYLLFFAVSGAVVAGLGGSALVRALARAGALRSFPAGAEARRARTGA